MFRVQIFTSFLLLLFILSGTQGLTTQMLGEQCDVDKECLTRQMTCEGVCSCIDGHYASEDRRSCIATEGSSCYETADCNGLLNSECHLNEKKCVCRKGYHPSEDKQECLAETRYQGSCKSSIQCQSTLGDFGVCDGELCACKSGYHHTVVEQRCIQDKYLNDDCQNATQCITKDFKENQATCREGRCVCRDGMSEYNGLCKEGSGANRLMISVISVLGYFIIKLLI